MNSRALLSLALLTSMALTAAAQVTETNAKEEERLEQLLRNESSDWYTPKTTASVGFRVLTSGGNVRFGNLGSVPFNVVAPASAGLVNRVYNDGTVSVDAPRSAEVDSLGNQISTQGGRYVGGASDLLAYTPGQTRSWSFSTPEQVAVPGYAGYVAMNNYSAASDGGALTKKQGISPGVELAFTRSLRKLSKKVELSVVAGIALNGINDKTSGNVQSTLLTNTDYYLLNLPAGATPPVASVAAPYTGPHYTDANQTVEDTVTISATPNKSSSNSQAGAVTVNGRWQVKGAYFMARLGPSLRAQVTDRFAINASVGVAGAFAGSQYTAVETMEVPLIGTTLTNTPDPSNTTKFLSGYYADLNLEWAANDTLGLFGGVSVQKLSSYDQNLAGRLAHVDLGNALGLRGGMNIKF